MRTRGSAAGPRVAGADLTALLHQLWPAPDGGTVAVLTGASRRDERRGAALDRSGLAGCERYAVVPGARRARFLVPLGSRRAAVASLLAYNRLRPGRTRFVRALLAAAFAVGLRRFVARDTLTVPRSERAAGDSSETLVDRIGRAVDVRSPMPAVGVHPPDPNHKPTLQLFDASGSVVGYAKVGWNAGTKALVRNEARALRDRGIRDARVAVPSLRWSGSWQGREVAVVTPLPPDVRRYRSLRPPPVSVTRAVAGEVSLRELSGSAWWACLLAVLHADGHDAEESHAATRLLQCARRLEQRAAGTPLAFGRWHGDWVPWNLAVARRTLHVFDWEHSSNDAPLGFDLLHWAFQVELVLRRHDVARAARAVDAAAVGGWPGLGVPAPEAVLIADLYLLEMATRTLRLKTNGGSWNRRLHPHLLSELSARLG